LINRVFPLLVFLCITRKPKKRQFIFTITVFTISCKTYSHRCQRKQMHQNYFRITMALCHLTAVLSFSFQTETNHSHHRLLSILSGLHSRSSVLLFSFFFIFKVKMSFRFDLAISSKIWFEIEITEDIALA